MPTPRRAAVLLVLLAALAGGLAVRLVGVRHGELELVFHPDVAKQTRVARHFFHGHNDVRGVFEDDVKRTMYPYGMSVVLGSGWRAYAAVSGDEGVDDVHRWTWALRMRHLSIVMFMLTSALALLLVSRNWTWPAMLTVGLLLWLEPVNAQMSHYGMNDVPLVGLLLLTWALASRMAAEPARLPWASLACGFTLGFAFGVKYQAVLGVLFPAATWVSAIPTRGWARSFVSLASLGFTFTAGLLLSCPLLVADPGYFLQSLPEFMAWQGNIMGEELPLGAKVLRNLSALRGVLVSPGYLALLTLGVLGCLAALLRKEEGKVQAVSAFTFCALLVAAVLFGRDFVRANDLLPVFAFLAVAVAPAVVLAQSAGRPARVAAVIVVVLAVGWFSAVSVLDSLALARPDTRVQAQAWCRENLEEKALVLRERYTLGVGRDDLTEREYRYLSSREARKRIERGRFDYLIASSLAHDRFGDPHSAFYDPEIETFYQGLEDNHQILARFQVREMLFAHPVIVVYGKREPR